MLGACAVRLSDAQGTGPGSRSDARRYGNHSGGRSRGGAELQITTDDGRGCHRAIHLGWFDRATARDSAPRAGGAREMVQPLVAAADRARAPPRGRSRSPRHSPRFMGTPVRPPLSGNRQPAQRSGGQGPSDLGGHPTLRQPVPDAVHHPVRRPGAHRSAFPARSACQGCGTRSDLPAGGTWAPPCCGCSTAPCSTSCCSAPVSGGRSYRPVGRWCQMRVRCSSSTCRWAGPPKPAGARTTACS